MTHHLSPEEFVDALDGTLDARRMNHVRECEACRAGLESARVALAEAQELRVPEPSPLFWDHFSARVTDATAAEVPRGRPAWFPGWRPLGAIATALGALALVIVLRPAPAPSVVPVSGPAAMDDGTWGLVVGLAAELSWSDVHEAATPEDGTADAVIQDLSAAQREALARLLQQEIGEF